MGFCKLEMLWSILFIMRNGEIRAVMPKILLDSEIILTAILSII